MKIAIVGAGVSGLVAAYLLHPEHQITVYEAAADAGGHTNTIRVDSDAETLHIDTGFIVFNDRNYPSFERLLDRLGVASQPSDMSFSVSDASGRFEYCSTSLNGLFAVRRHLATPSFLRMVLEVARFQRACRALLGAQPPGPSLGAWLAQQRFSSEFIERLIIPQASAVWSADPRQMWSFPAAFSRNSSTTTGCSPYAIDPNGKLFAAARRATSRSSRVCWRRGSGCRPRPNEAVLHTDTRMLPRRRRAWASWNYHLLAGQHGRAAVTYDMNRLQSLRSRRQFCVTLNRTGSIDPHSVIATIAYAHPVFTAAGVAAQQRVGEISGVNRSHFCGAYWGWGFHEDGVRSAVRVSQSFGASL